MMNSESSSLDHCVIVMAHPDDEALWASGALGRADRIILCFGDVPGHTNLSQCRRAAMERYPLEGGEHLDITEAGVFGSGGWPLPAEIPSGVRCRREAETYDANFQRLLEQLSKQLQNASVVVTHNPWGEYGHEEHIQVFKAVAKLQQKFDYAIYVSGYCSNHSVLLMQRHLARLGSETALLTPNMNLADELQKHYIRHGCWTWLKDYEWPLYELYYPLLSEVTPKAKPQRATTHTMNFVWLDAPLRLSLTLDPFA